MRCISSLTRRRASRARARSDGAAYGGAASRQRHAARSVRTCAPRPGRQRRAAPGAARRAPPPRRCGDAPIAAARATSTTQCMRTRSGRCAPCRPKWVTVLPKESGASWRSSGCGSMSSACASSSCHGRLRGVRCAAATTATPGGVAVARFVLDACSASGLHRLQATQRQHAARRRVREELQRQLVGHAIGRALQLVEQRGERCAVGLQVGRRQRRQRGLARRQHVAGEAAVAASELGDVVVQALDLEGERARVGSSRTSRSSTGSHSGAHQVARAVGDDRVGAVAAASPARASRPSRVARLQRGARGTAGARCAGRSTGSASRGRASCRRARSPTASSSRSSRGRARPAPAAAHRGAARWNTGSPISWLSVRQLSSDMRSRRLKATRASSRRPLQAERASSRMRGGAQQRRRRVVVFARAGRCAGASASAGAAPSLARRRSSSSAGERHAQQARGGVAALAVAAEPEQVLGHARRQVGARRAPGLRA